MENYNLESARELINSAEKELSKEFEKAEEICEFNSEKVLKAFQENRVNEADFGSTTGYGYGDIGREKIEKVFADVLRAEDCIVRGQFISGTHALTVALFAFLRPGDTLFNILSLDNAIPWFSTKYTNNSYSLRLSSICFPSTETVLP